MAKPKNIVTSYNFELPSDDDIKALMKNGLSKRIAINFLGNSKILSQNKNIKEHHILDDLSSVIDVNNHSEKIYYDNQTVGYTDNTNFYNVVGKQILNLHLFGYRNIKAVKFTKNYVKVQLYAFDGSQWIKSYLIFKKLSSYNPDIKEKALQYENHNLNTNPTSPLEEENYKQYELEYKNVLFVNDDKFADANKLDIISDFNQNVIISNNHVYEYRNHIYVGASFYATVFFHKIFESHQTVLSKEEQVSLVENEKQKFQNNHFEFGGRMDTLNLPDKIAKDYRISFKNSVEVQDWSTYYDYYGTYESINEYLDQSIINRYKDFSSFAEYELSFALRYVANNLESFSKDNHLSLVPTTVVVDEVVKKQLQKEPVDSSMKDNDVNDETEEVTDKKDNDETNVVTSEEPLDDDPLDDFMKINKSEDKSELNNKESKERNVQPSSQSESPVKMMSDHAHQPSFASTSDSTSAQSSTSNSSLSNNPKLQGLLNKMVDNLQNSDLEQEKVSEKETNKKDDKSSDNANDNQSSSSAPRTLNGVDLSDFS